MEEINALGARSKRLAENLTTEEATKTALILPFIQLLGFDIFNPTEVIPEYQAEAGVKKISVWIMRYSKMDSQLF